MRIALALHRIGLRSDLLHGLALPEEQARRAREAGKHAAEDTLRAA